MDIGKDAALALLMNCEHRNGEKGPEVFHEGVWKDIAKTDFKDDVGLYLRHQTFNLTTRQWEWVRPTFDDVVRMVQTMQPKRWWGSDDAMRVTDKSLYIITHYSDG